MRYIHFLLFLMLLGACKRPPTQTLPAQNGTGIAQEHPSLPPVGKDFRSLKLDSKVKYDVGFRLQLRLVRDSAMWVSVSKFGVEGLRAIITQDSVHILDKQKDTYYARRFDTLEVMLNFRLDFKMLQAVLLANMPIAEYDTAKVQLERSLLKIPQEKDGIALTNFLHKPTEKLHELFLVDKRTKNTLQIFYEDFKQIDGNAFAERNRAFLTFWDKNTQRIEKKEVQIDYNSVKFLRTSVDMPFNIPRNYKRK